MANDFGECPVCGKTLTVPRGRKWCPNCAIARERNIALIENAVMNRGVTIVHEIADFTGIEVDEVHRLVRETPALSREVDTGEPCVQCGLELAQKGSQYCLRCRLDLFNTFDEAADLLADKVDRLPPEHESSSLASLRDVLSDKRSRTGTSRFNPTPGQRRAF